MKRIRFIFLTCFFTIGSAHYLHSQVTGSGEPNFIALWAASQGGSEDNPTSVLGYSVIYQASGLIGINTTTPNADFHVLGSGLFEEDASPSRLFTRLVLGHDSDLEINSSNSIGYLGFNAQRSNTGAWLRKGDGTYNGGALICGNTKGDLNFSVFPSSGGSSINTMSTSDVLSNIKMTIDHTGKLGLGTTAPQVGKMEIVQSQADNSKYALVLNQESNSLKSIEMQYDYQNQVQWAVGTSWFENDSARNSFFIWNEKRTSYALTIHAGLGWVGIEQPWPSAKLDVNGSFKAGCAGIGVNPPDENSSWKLFVNGGIKAREIKVTTQSFADYVFTEKYSLPSIADLDRFIKQNKHLPGMPSADEVCQNEGIELGSMQVKLLEKVEEQALYIISLQKQIDELRALVIPKGEGER